MTETIEIEEGANEHAMVDIDLKLEVLDLRKHRHVHLHKCKRIGVAVNFNADTKEHKFPPNTTVGIVTDWARKKFHLDPAVAGEYCCKSAGPQRSLVQPNISATSFRATPARSASTSSRK